jgi:hypothetical protein
MSPRVFATAFVGVAFLAALPYGLAEASVIGLGAALVVWVFFQLRARRP